MYVHTCAHMNLCSQEAKRQEKGPHLFPMSSRLSPQVCPPSKCLSAMYTPPRPAHPSQALRMLVKMMHVHSAAVITAILHQLCYSSVLEVSSRAA